VPPRDSTAYIIDQFVLPTDKDMIAASSRRLLYYHIGFTDLPAAKLLVPCHKVLDYVSPRELEDWEYKILARKEEERALLLAKQRAAPPKRKPGRPPKVPMEDVGVPGLSRQDDTLLLAEEVAGPSLSTPEKRRLGRVLDEEMGDTSNMESDDAAIHRQLQGDPESEDMEFEDELEADSESVDQLVVQYDTPSAETPPRASSSVPPLGELSRASSAATPTKAGLPSYTPADQAYAPSNGSTPGRIHPAWANAFGRQNLSEMPAKAQSHNGHVQQKETPWSLSASTKQPAASRTAPIPGPSFYADAGSKHLSPRVSTPDIGACPATTAGSSASKRKGQTNGKGSSHEKQPKTKKPKIEPEPEPAADEWEVKDLLDDQWFVENGVKVHKYLVLWEGDWPEDQNPTWEPAENVVDEALLKRYQKKKAGLLKPPKKQKTLHQCLGARYSSVAEAR
jgi:hypothetical protein